MMPYVDLTLWRRFCTPFSCTAFYHHRDAPGDGVMNFYHCYVNFCAVDSSCVSLSFSLSFSFSRSFCLFLASSGACMFVYLYFRLTTAVSHGFNIFTNANKCICKQIANCASPTITPYAVATQSLSQQ